MITETKIQTIPESPETTPSLSPKNNKSGKGKNKFLFLAIFSLLISITTVIWLDQIHKPSDADKIELEDLEGKMNDGYPLEYWEKERFCELLDKVKGVKLFACKENYICKIGNLTGYPVKETDLDWRGLEKTFTDALNEAFKRTGLPRDVFVPVEWAKDLNGKTGVVHWIGPEGSEVSVDAPHIHDGPDVFHIGFKLPGKRNKKDGHIFLDCVPYFRKQNEELFKRIYR